MRIAVVLFLFSNCQLLAQTSEKANGANRLEINRLSSQQLADLARNANVAEIAGAFEAAFKLEADPEKRASLAQLMVRNQSQNPEYLGFLMELADKAVASDTPSLYQTDSSGSIIRGQLNPEFVEWCNRNGKVVANETSRQMFELPGYVATLGYLAVPAAAPIFRVGLHSRNSMVVAQSALGLANIGDTTDIPAIIKAEVESKVEITNLMMAALARFGNSQSIIRDQLRGTKYLDTYERAVAREQEIKRSKALSGSH